MPRTEGRVPVELRVRREGEREEWDRRIGGWRFRTEQWGENGLMAETFGPLLFLASVSSDQESVSHVSRRMLLCALGRRWPVPRRLSIHTWGVERRSASNPGAMDVSVRIEAPFGQLLVGYDGTLQVSDPLSLQGERDGVRVLDHLNAEP